MKKHRFPFSPFIHTLIASSCALLWMTAPYALAQNKPALTSASSTTDLPVITNLKPDLRNQQAPVTNRPGTAETGQRSAFHSQDLPFEIQRSAFQSYVRGVTDQELPVFGRELFREMPDTFAPISAVQVNPDYIIGTGDELQIRGWGMVDIDLNVTVDRSGAIYIPRVGSVKVAGVKYRDLQAYLKSAVGKIFSNFDLTASIAQTRAVQVYVVGHAVRPGTYTLSAMSTLVNALFTSGGPDASGSMRNIQVKRGGKTVTTFDVYDMLINGDKSKDVPLEDGDIIYIPEVGPLVALTGNVKKPAIFELNGNSSLSDLLGWAGGFDSAAARKQVVIEKNVDNKYVTIANLVADQNGAGTALASIPLQPADILRVFSPGAVPVEAQIKNEYVRVGGEVMHTGVFKIKKGETLRELIARLGGVNEDGYLYAMQFNRESVRRAQQAKLDEAADRFEQDIEATANSRMAGKSDKDNIDAITTELARQRQLAQRLRSVKAEGRIVLELANGDAEVKNLPDLPLQDGDSIYIPRKPGTVNVIGSVFQQGAFIYKPRRTVNDYLALAGGAMVNAETSETYLLHADGTAQSGRNSGLFNGLGGASVNPGDAIVVPEKIDRSSWTQSLKEWTSILYQFGLGAAGLKVLKN